MALDWYPLMLFLSPWSAVLPNPLAHQLLRSVPLHSRASAGERAFSTLQVVSQHRSCISSIRAAHKSSKCRVAWPATQGAARFEAPGASCTRALLIAPLLVSAASAFCTVSKSDPAAATASNRV